MSIRDKYIDLLKDWCDKLVGLQMHDSNLPKYLDGGMICPACKMIHGRIPDSIYPLIFMFDQTKDNKYIRSAELLFKWSENMLADDGSYYNDAQNDWNGITVFFVSMLARALIYHEDVIPNVLKKQFKERVEKNIFWVMETITDDFEANINYHTAAAEAAALCWKYFGKLEYSEYAKKRAEYCLRFFDKRGFFVGESHPATYLSPRGVRGVDIGYNLEESLPALCECAEILNIKKLKEIVHKSAILHAGFLLPDGAMDNSFGSRNYKWTYWGSRTSDSYLAMFEILGREDRTFLKYKYATYDILCKCTDQGLLYGGIDYKAHGELPCIHHTFCKAKAVAAMLDVGIEETSERLALPKKSTVKRYPEILSDQIFYEGFYALVTFNDVFYLKGGHVSGGTISLLWHEKTGPVIAASMMKYSLYEPTNSQLSLRKKDYGKTSLRYEFEYKGHKYASDQDFFATVISEVINDSVKITVSGRLKDIDGNTFINVPCLDSGYHIVYTFYQNTLIIECDSENDGKLCLPIIASGFTQMDGKILLFDGKYSGKIRVTINGIIDDIQQVFNLCGGFIAYRIDAQKGTENKLKVLLEIE